MRILFLTQVLPYPLDAGPKVRAHHMLQYLAARHQVTLVSFVRKSDRPEAIAHMRALCHAFHAVPLERSRAADLYNAGVSLLSGQPFTIVRDVLPQMTAKITEVVAEQSFDAIHADQLSMAAYALQAEQEIAKRHTGAKLQMVLDAHNAYYLIPQRMAEVASNPLMRVFLRREAGLIARYEAVTYRRFQHVLTVTDEDQAAIKSLAAFEQGAPQFKTLPICVDGSTPALDFQPGAKGVLMLGGLHWPPNADAARWFVHDIWPQVRARVPDAQLYIVGAHPPDDVRVLGDFNGIERPEQANGAPIVVTGYVNDPGPFIRASAALMVALRSGGGMRVKIVEAMQWGLPVVSTTIGCEGIDVTPGQDMLVADRPEDLAASMARVLEDRAEAQRLSAAARLLIAQRYDWHKVYLALDHIYPIHANSTQIQ
jgi:glycosyltransferase involved in cell wall biosynthesis